MYNISNMKYKVIIHIATRRPSKYLMLSDDTLRHDTSRANLSAMQYLERFIKFVYLLIFIIENKTKNKNVHIIW